MSRSGALTTGVTGTHSPADQLLREIDDGNCGDHRSDNPARNSQGRSHPLLTHEVAVSGGQHADTARTDPTEGVGPPYGEGEMPFPLLVGAAGRIQSDGGVPFTLRRVPGPVGGH
jgi:hypothetical protein